MDEYIVDDEKFMWEKKKPDRNQPSSGNGSQKAPQFLVSSGKVYGRHWFTHFEGVKKLINTHPSNNVGNAH